MKFSVPFVLLVTAMAVAVEAGGSAEIGEVKGYVLENKLEGGSGSPGDIAVTKRTYSPHWVKINTKDKTASLQNGETMEMVDGDAGSTQVAVDLHMYNKKGEIQVNALPDGAQAESDLSPTVASSDKRLLQTSLWFDLNHINDIMGKFIVERCRLPMGGDKKMKIVWSDQEDNQIAAMANVKTPEFPLMKVSRVPQNLVDGDEPHHAAADSHVVAHEYAHYFTSCTWKHHLSGEQSDEADAINEAISDVATLAIRSQLATDLEAPSTWLIGENLGVNIESNQYLRKYFLDLNAAARATTDMTGREKQMVENLSFDRFEQRHSMNIEKVKDFYATGMIMATAWMKTIKGVYEIIKAGTSKKGKEHYGRAAQVVLQAIFAALDSSFKGDTVAKGLSDFAYFMKTVYMPITRMETAAGEATVNRNYRWPGTFLHLQRCFIAKLKDVPEISSLSADKKKEVMRAAWTAFADHGMGPGAYINWKIDSVAPGQFGGLDVETTKTFHGDNTVPALEAVEAAATCDLPADLTPDGHHSQDEMELGEAVAPRLRGHLGDDSQTTEESELPGFVTLPESQ